MLREGESPPGANGRPHRLTDRWKAMIDHYFTDAEFNETKAARLTGYKHPNQYAYRLFRLPAVKAEVERRRRMNSDKYDISHETIMAEMAKIGFLNIADLMTFDEKTGEFISTNISKETVEKLAAVGEVTTRRYKEGRGDDAVWVTEVRVKPYNKLAALEAMMRHGGLSKDKGHEALDNLVDLIRSGRERALGKSDDDSKN